MDLSQLKPRSYQEVDRLLQAPGALYELEQRVIFGREQRVWKNAPNTLRDYMMESFERWQEHEFVSEPLPEPAPASQRQSKTYKQVYDDALQWAGWLREKGVRVGDKVAIGARNSSSYIAAYCAICFLGAVPVLLNTTLTGDTQVHCLYISKPKLTIGDAAFALVAPKKAVLVAKGVSDEIYSWDNLDHLDGSVRANVTYLSKVAPSGQTVKDIIAGKGLESLAPESDATLLFTSGTTSLPKAVLSTQRQVAQSIISGSYLSARYAARMGAPMEMAFAQHIPETRSVMLHAVPLFHVTGEGMLTRSIVVGQKLVFMRKWSPETAMDLILAEGVNNLTGVPALAAGILASPRLREAVKLEAIMYGGAPAPANLAARVQKQWGQATIGHLYGSTEVNGLFTALAGADYLKNPTTVGPPIPILDVKVVDPDTRAALPTGSRGLLLFRGGSVMKEYYNNPKATAAALQDGWYDSGDVGYVDEENNVYISDRIKDMIIRGGENIASAEIENAVYRDDRILEAAAVGVPCPVMTEQVGLAVSLKEGITATAESIQEALNSRLRPQARPIVVHIWDGLLPRNANGKIVKDDVKTVVRAKWDQQGRAKL